jgi:hypothetical protein
LRRKAFFALFVLALLVLALGGFLVKLARPVVRPA